jgi:hypothetical protein
MYANKIDQPPSTFKLTIAHYFYFSTKIEHASYCFYYIKKIGFIKISFEKEINMLAVH